MGECDAWVVLPLGLRAQGHGRVGMSVETTVRQKMEGEVVTAAAFLWCPEEKSPTATQNRGPCLKPGPSENEEVKGYWKVKWAGCETREVWPLPEGITSPR